jgi:hypothetical protein
MFSVDTVVKSNAVGTRRFLTGAFRGGIIDTRADRVRILTEHGFSWRLQTSLIRKKFGIGCRYTATHQRTFSFVLRTACASRWLITKSSRAACVSPIFYFLDCD